VDVEQDRGIIRHLVMLFPCASNKDAGLDINMVDGSGLHPISKSTAWGASLQIRINKPCLALEWSEKDPYQ
jgi:hypothetical protein